MAVRCIQQLLSLDRGNLCSSYFSATPLVGEIYSGPGERPGRRSVEIQGDVCGMTFQTATVQVSYKCYGIFASETSWTTTSPMPRGRKQEIQTLSWGIGTNGLTSTSSFLQQRWCFEGHPLAPVLLMAPYWPAQA
ncbi:hypothetical protein E2C01_019515 [Portunus trituberculatus]|uniref:Uncharacterized protein n=1 Tax=Portunus trituberculatus TaxID=210409 RepID=A0A5B7DXF4_PORTR|nr:hypothetical protein [Portunus trituberculatus]